MCVGVRARIVYTAEQLIALRSAVVLPRDRHEITAEVLVKSRRGRRAGKLRREKTRRFRPAVPSVIMGNVRSLANKIDELAALTRYQREYRTSSVLLFTETWLTSLISDSTVALDKFHLLRADRTENSGKRKGGGLAVFVNIRWCMPRHCTVKMKLCNRDIELLAVGMRPFYLPREFTHVIIIAVYVPPSANADTASETLLSVTSRLQTQHPQALFLISGDFNHAPPSAALPTYTQYVTCPTRDNKTLDLFYANTKEAYAASSLPPLGRADHNILHLLPVYKPVVHRQPVVPRTVKRWTAESEEALRDCFNTTVWTELCDPHGEDINAITDCVTDYINFCCENTVPTRRVLCFTNSKPWVTPDIKALLKEKKRAFKSGDREELRRAQKELRRKIREGKSSYRRKMEEQLQQNNVSEVWRSLKTISGFKAPHPQAEGDLSWVNELNSHFNRFDQAPTHTSQQLPPNLLSPHTTGLPAPTALHTFTQSPLPSALTTGDSSQPHPLTSHHTKTLPPPLSFSSTQVRSELRKIKARKAAGPDGISSRLLKSCAGELCGVMEHVFNLSLKLRVVPQLWKTSCVVPVPKTPHAKDPSSFRPVALTSHLMKTLERLVLGNLRSAVGTYLDPLQFAYRHGIGVDDAVIFLLHRALSHLEKPGSTVRIMFFDFSRAFNTIQPMLLKHKLEEAGVDLHLTEWIMDYLTNRPQFVRARDCVSDTLTCSVGAPQGTVLAPFLFTLYTSDFRHNTDSCVLQKFSDDSAIVGLITDDDDAEYRGLTQNFVDWCQRNHLLINVGKTKEMVVDFRRQQPALIPPMHIQGRDIERVDSYKYLGVHLNNKLDWTHNTDALYRKGQSRLYLLRRLRSFGVKGPLLKTFYDSVVASAILYGVVCWGSSITARDRKRLDRIIRKSSSVLGCTLDTVQEVGERRVLAKLTSIMDQVSHPLEDSLSALESSFSSRLIHPRCVKERYRRSFLPAAVRLYNQNC
ncbi:uncharacterized protein LOC129604646 [Betta splendens]|uniref:Uncharacterized protein LOC129604646 n=1 Tax=Betta splendens TaxID=158456 RepID=A0A9W2Y2A5_BETSP|nr:uncharacterized protein LOC129604646 [Betta splendens]